MMMNKGWREENMQRVLNMDRWYVLDGRHRKNHPMHGLYTGLAEIGETLDRQNELTTRMSKAYDRLCSH
tara:strand:+ start:478 stop:684 length:207 start_codon:yes stop_codon:yes gene_type:complete